jgi:hypothetical protein
MNEESRNEGHISIMFAKQRGNFPTTAEQTVCTKIAPHVALLPVQTGKLF